MEGLDVDVVTEPTDGLRRSVHSLSARVEESGRGHEALSEHKRMALARKSWGPGSPESVALERTDPPVAGTHEFGVLVARSGGAEAVGYAQVSGDRRRNEYVVELLVDPGSDEPAEVADVLVLSTIDEIANRGGGDLRLWRAQAGEEDDKLAARHGFRPERELIQMRCRLPLPARAGTPPVDHRPPPPTRSFRPGVDEAAWLIANNRSFASHPEQGHWDLDTLLEREQEAWFDPEGFLVLEVEGRIAGSCWTKVHAHATPPMGEIYVIGVDPDFHGRGWGRDLTQAGLDWLAGQGLSVGMLYVDGANRTAVNLYRSMGFSEDHVDRSYVRRVDGMGRQ